MLNGNHNDPVVALCTIYIPVTGPTPIETSDGVDINYKNIVHFKIPMMESLWFLSDFGRKEWMLYKMVIIECSDPWLY